jgi:hypothetical protein
MTPDRAWVLLPSGWRLDLLTPDPSAWTDSDLATGLSRTYIGCGIIGQVCARARAARIAYDRMRTVFNREDPETSHIVYNRTLLAYLPKACKAYRAKTKGKVERPSRYIREEFFLGRSFRNFDDLNAQFRQWLDQVAQCARCCELAGSALLPLLGGPAAGALVLSSFIALPLNRASRQPL